MSYKILGMLVWNVGKWYVRRKVEFGTAQKATLVALSAAVIAGGVVAGRQAASDSDSND